MSLPGKKQQPPLGNLFCAALSMLFALALSALAASFGTTYESRVTLYLVALLWAVAGNVTLAWLTRNGTGQISAAGFIKWFVGSWLWPLMLLAKAIKRR